MASVLKAINLTSSLIFSAGCFQPHTLSCLYDELVPAHRALASLHVAAADPLNVDFVLRRKREVEDLEVRLSDYWLLGECVGPIRS